MLRKHTTADGQTMLVAEMKDSHLINLVNPEDQSGFRTQDIYRPALCFQQQTGSEDVQSAPGR